MGDGASDSVRQATDPRTLASFGSQQSQFLDHYRRDQPSPAARSSVSSKPGDDEAKTKSKSGRVVFRDDDDDELAVLSRRRRRTTEKGVAVATGTVGMGEDPRAKFTFKALGSRSSSEYQPLTRTHSSSPRAQSHLHSSSPRPQSHLRSLPPPGLEGWGSQQQSDPLRDQRLNCEPQGREFDHFSEMMLESALADDADGCGQSLLCIIGRTPIQSLPPKAIGLRSLLK